MSEKFTYVEEIIVLLNNNINECLKELPEHMSQDDWAEFQEYLMMQDRTIEAIKLSLKLNCLGFRLACSSASYCENDEDLTEVVNMKVNLIELSDSRLKALDGLLKEQRERYEKYVALIDECIREYYEKRRS